MKKGRLHVVSVTAQRKIVRILPEIAKKTLTLHSQFRHGGGRPHGEMAEWSIAAVLKTVEGHTSGGSNPSLSAISIENQCFTNISTRFYAL